MNSRGMDLGLMDAKGTRMAEIRVYVEGPTVTREMVRCGMIASEQTRNSR